jgi:hypothetical protein
MRALFIERPLLGYGDQRPAGSGHIRDGRVTGGGDDNVGSTQH